MTEHLFDSDESLLAALEARLLALLRDAIKTRGHAVLAVSGGNTPKPLFERLAKSDLDFAHVFITLVDERWVDTDDDASNEKMVRATLLTGSAARAHFIPLKNAARSAAAGVAATTAALATLPTPFDCVILGMGDDGHTASLFPGAKELSVGLTTDAPCLSVTPPVAPHERMSLSAHRILETRQLILHISGPQKRAALSTALAEGPVQDHPIRLFLRQKDVPIDVYATR